jgi:hypothetical protein
MRREIDRLDRLRHRIGQAHLRSSDFAAGDSAITDPSVGRRPLEILGPTHLWRRIHAILLQKYHSASGFVSRRFVFALSEVITDRKTWHDFIALVTALSQARPPHHIPVTCEFNSCVRTDSMP